MEDIAPHHPQKNPDDLKAYAREMRKKMPTAEQLLWYVLRNRRVAGAKFRRQHPVGRYILDFYCVEKKLAVELDGGQHSEQQNYDQQRDAYLKKQGIEVLRFWNNQMLLETEAVLEVIYSILTKSPPRPLAGEG
ncbi:endonuclease domain-containing protein [Undibacterium seohonense]|uniref:Endonuclease domain-containing protein n=1 Tax=Undibacterium seohonense TaxID=1344950 RepID=A0ABR6X2J2_9BURK|nr:endonuclease domain-containing protein [Undibacterium seohonense]MBC3807183.1 endonuclease domain-containing protein [Undibacterium seohonense]